MLWAPLLPEDEDEGDGTIVAVALPYIALRMRMAHTLKYEERIGGRRHLKTEENVRGGGREGNIERRGCLDGAR